MLRIAVALGNRSKYLHLTEVREALARAYGEEAIVFGVADRVTKLSEATMSSRGTFEESGAMHKTEGFVEEARRRYPHAGVYVGIKSANMEQARGVWEELDYISIATEGSNLRSLTILGHRNNKALHLAVDTAGQTEDAPKMQHMPGKTHAEYLVGIINLTQEQVAKSTPQAPTTRNN